MSKRFVDAANRKKGKTFNSSNRDAYRVDDTDPACRGCGLDTDLLPVDNSNYDHTHPLRTRQYESFLIQPGQDYDQDQERMNHPHNFPRDLDRG